MVAPFFSVAVMVCAVVFRRRSKFAWRAFDLADCCDLPEMCCWLTAFFEGDQELTRLSPNHRMQRTRRFRLSRIHIVVAPGR